MADISVHIFVQNLKELMKSQNPNIAGEKDQLEYLYKDFFLMSSFLKKLEEKFSFDNEKVNNLVTEIREVVFQAEIIVDYFVINELSLDLQSLEKQTEKVKIEMDQMNVAFDQSIVVGDVGEKIQKKTVSRERSGDSLEAVVGIDETVDKILAGFDADQEMEVISVVGLPGIGKTTLAEKVFEHSRTRSSFQVRAWVTVSQTYSSKRLLIEIMQSSSLYEDGDADSNEDRLSEVLLKRLKGRKYLIVLDDIWSIEAWNGIQRSFPPNHNGSKVLFTSRFAAVAKDVCGDINSHNVSCLSEEHSWNLLKNKVLRGGDCPPELERFGREIAKKCGGLPLAIVVIGGILANKDKTTEQWEQVAERLAPAIATDREAYMDTLALSYQHLPVHLKACFLYLGSIFPEDYDIPLRKLVWLLVAEGFALQETHQQIKSLEVITEGYLDELVDRSLVTVSRKRSCGAPKTFRIHDLLRDFCLVRGQQEKFICKHDRVGAFSSLESALKEQRRLIVSFIVSYRFPDAQFTSNLRSLFCDYDLPCDDIRLLKVLEAWYSVGNFVKVIENMVHLRSCLKKLARTPNLKKLGLLGSLISASGCSTIPDLGFLEQLVTLKVTNSSFHSHRSSVLIELKLPASLRKLTLQNMLLKWKEISVLAELENLEALKLLDNACVEEDGNSDWDTSELDFPKLKYLKMWRLDIVLWDDQNLQCECLEVLVLEECQRLESIPFDLALSSSLHTIEMTRCTTSVGILAKEIEAEHENQFGDTDLRVFIKS